jgi:hypothetical protein
MIGGLEVIAGKEEQKRDEWEMGLGAAAAKSGVGGRGGSLSLEGCLAV